MSEWKEILDRYRSAMDAAVELDLENLGPAGILRDACAHALLKSGSNRFRSSLVLMLGHALNPEADVSTAALGIEYIVVTAKTVDDFPSMDNTDQRGEVPSVHKQFGEGVALLASYSLIAAGFRCMARQSEQLAKSSLPFAPESDLRMRSVVESLGWNIGIGGAAGGQLLDLTTEKGKSIEEIQAIIDVKTGSLYEMACVTGWAFGGGPMNQLDAVRKMGRHIGRVMQMQDDLADQQQDAALNRNANLANAFGFPVAREIILLEIRGYLRELKNLGLEGGELPKLVEPVIQYLGECQKAAAVNC